MSAVRPKIVLHVGTEKTGTTSIQSILKASRSHLMQNQVLFPSTLGQLQHLSLTACALENDFSTPLLRLLNIKSKPQFEDFKAQVLQSFGQEIVETSPRKIIISDEHINAHLPSIAALRRYQQLCREFGEIDSVIIYLRRQDKYFLSMFSEAVKAGDLDGFTIKSPLSVPGKIPYNLRYLKILDKLGEVFGQEKLKVRVFDKRRLVGGQLLNDFAAQADIRFASQLEQGESRNRSLDARVIYHLAVMSRFLRLFDGRYSRSIRRRCLNRATRLFDGPGPRMSPEAHEAFMERFGEENEIIKKKYMQYLPADEPLFPGEESAEAPDKPTYPECTMPAHRFWGKMIAG